MFKAWVLLAIGGLLLNGFGLCLFGEAVVRKSDGLSWFWMGTASLVCINAGICFVIEAGKKASH
ncbi:MAG: hypothetical protein AAF558_03295 [Verrucomicrobiota bacterium]